MEWLRNIHDDINDNNWRNNITRFSIVKSFKDIRVGSYFIQIIKCSWIVSVFNLFGSCVFSA